MLKKICAAALGLVMAVSVGCGGTSDPGETEIPEGNEVQTEVNMQNYKKELALEQDYVYMWNRDGLRGEECVVNFQTPVYAMQVNGKLGKIVSLGQYKSLSDTKYTEADFTELAQTEMNFYLTEENEEHSGKEVSGAYRIIDSGRAMQRMDYLNIRYEGYALEKLGRVEYAASLNHFAINYELHSKTATTAGLKFSLKIEGTSSVALENGRGVKMVDSQGNGFAFLRPADDEFVNVTAEGDTVICSKEEIDVPAITHTGFGVIVVPLKGGSEELLEQYLALEAAEVTAEQISPGTGELPVKFDTKRGLFEVNITSVAVGTQGMEANRKRYERVRFTIKNAGADELDVPLVFRKDKGASFSVTGMSPMIRDAQTLEPAGEQVQISKNWHTFSGNSADFNYMSGDNPAKHSEGPWYNGYVTLPVDEAEKSYEYTCAYGNWGEVYAASHGQLCLIGWGGNMVWDQSALGSWGENVTYDPDIVLNRSAIDDVRPFLVTAPQGNNNQFDWTGNVGGADFLNYLDKEDSGESRVIDRKITYTTQAPNLTQVTYSGITDNGKIAAEVGINLGRTDDIVRNYYTLRYTFLQDVDFGRLSLFKVAADGYADNQFTKYALGDDQGAIEFDKASAGTDGYRTETLDADGENFWFMLYNSTNADENGDVMFIVREYSAKIGDKEYTKPGYRLYGTNNGTPQTSCEVTVPSAVGTKIPAGSTIEMVVEYDILPGNAQTYYGQSDYLLQTKDSMGTYIAGYQQVVGGTVSAEASVGEIVSSYPVRISAEEGEVAAQFTLTGGLGYVPIAIDGLSGYSGYKLQVKSGAQWQDINQSVSGNDYWQAYRDPQTGKYQLVYNVKNTNGLNFGTATEYRLIKA